MALYLFDAHPTWTPAFLQGCRQGQVLLPPRSAALPLYVPLQGHPLAPEPGMGSFGVAPVDNVPFAIPFGQTHFCDMAALSWIDKEARKFHINRAVFDLVSPGGVLELTDPKLLGWYLSLAVEDRSLVQEEGGLLQFLQKHPALDVTRNCVYTKISGLYRTRRDHQDVPEMSSKLNKSRRPAFYSLSERRRCEHGFSLDAPKPGQSCPLPPPTLCLSEMERELLPRCIKQELNLSAPPRAPGSEAMVRGAGDTPLDFAESFQMACESRCKAGDWEDGVAVRESPSTSGVSSDLWVTGASAGEETLGRANTSLDVELELRGRETGVDECVPGPPGPSGAQAEQLSLDLEKETLPQYYSFSSSALDLTATRPGDWETEQCCGRVPAARHTMRQGGGGEAEVTDTSFTSSSLSSSSSSAALGASTDWPDEEQYLDCDFAGRVDASGDFEMEEPPASSRSTAQPIPRQAGDVASCAVPVGRDRRGVQTSDPSMGTRLGQWGGWALAEAELTRDASADPGELSCSQESFMSALPDDSLGVSPLAADGPGQEGERGTGEARGAFGTVPGLGAREGEEPGPVWSALQTSTEALAAPVTASQTGQDQVSRDTNAQPGPAHRRDVAVGTETPAKDRGTQTCPPTTAEKHVITDMYMSDLDYFVEEFLKLRAAEAELRELKDKAQSPAGGGLGTPGGCGSDCAQRAVKAELRLLALQYRLCEQHCWRLYYTAHEGALCSPGLPPPGSVLGALQGLCAQYREIRAQVQAGMSLDQLPPLSISCSCLVTERPYCPAQMMEEDSLLEEAPCGVEERCRGPVQHSAAETLQAAADGGAGRGGVGASEQHSGSVGRGAGRVGANGTQPANTPPINRHHDQPAKDQSVSENWFDAAEDLVPPSQGAPRQDRAGVQRQGREESVTCAEERPTGDDRGPSYHLCVRNLSEDVTEEALMSLFQKYQATGVWFTNVGNNAKVAIVTVGSARGAETAVQEMNGRAVQGRAIKVDGINKPPVAMQGSSRASRPSPPCPAAAAAKPFIRNLAKRIVVQETPTSSGTFAPPHYATLGSFDRLMAQLSQRHPEASRHRIVAALQELRARKEGFLSGLPLRDILEMTSDLLRGQATASARV